VLHFSQTYPAVELSDTTTYAPDGCLPHPTFFYEAIRQVKKRGWLVHEREVEFPVAFDKTTRTAALSLEFTSAVQTVVDPESSPWYECLTFISTYGGRQTPSVFVGLTHSRDGSYFDLTELSYGRRPTAPTLADDINSLLGLALTELRAGQQRMDRLADTACPSYRMDEIIVQAGAAKIIPWSNLKYVYEYAKGVPWKRRTAWSMILAGDAAIRHSPPLLQRKRAHQFRRLVEEVLL
jgi:hypothetical protein